MTRFGRCLLELTETYPIPALIRNFSSRLERLAIGQVTLPCTCPLEGAQQAWTVSLASMILGAGQDELDKLAPLSGLICRVLLAFLAPLLRLGKVDRIVGINNAGLSTNLYDQAFLDLDKEILTQVACQTYSDRALMVRSLNQVHHGNVLSDFEKAGWLMLVTRQIYLIDDLETALKQKDNRKDAGLLADGRYTFRQLTEESDWSDFVQTEELYRQLYVDKYSPTNVQFTALLFQEMVARKVLMLYLLEDQSGQAQGCLGMIAEDGLLTTPVLGYNRSLPLSEGLYRRLCLFIKRYCLEHGWRQHSSSGASSFKKSRGATPHLEYSAIYVGHLPWYRKLFWKGVVALSRGFYAPLLEREGL